MSTNQNNRIKLRPFQQQWIRSIVSNRQTFILGARQIGKSTSVAVAAIFIAAGWTGTAQDVLILSKDLRASQQMIRSIKRELRNTESITGEQIKDPRLGSESRIALVNGCYIQAFPGNPDSLQGFTGTVIIDELEANASNGTNTEEIFSQAMFVSSANPNFRIVIVTNAGATNGFTDKLLYSDEPRWQSRRSAFAITNTNVYDAYPNGLPKHIQAMKDQLGDLEWQRWYMNESVEGAEQLISELQLMECTRTGPHSMPRGGIRILSIDPGFVNNPSGVVIVEYGNGKANIIHSDHWYKMPIPQQLQNITELIRQYSVSKIIIDQGTQGWGMAQSLKEKYPTMTTTRNTNTNTRDREGAALQTLIRERRLHIPEHMIDLIEDLKLLYTDEKQHINLGLRRVSNGCDVHGDAADALLYCMEHLTSTVERTSNNIPRNMNFNPIENRLW